MEACLSIKFAYLDWLTCKKCLLGGHGKARRTVTGVSYARASEFGFAINIFQIMRARKGGKINVVVMLRPSGVFPVSD